MASKSGIVKHVNAAIQSIPEYLQHGGPVAGLENVECGDVTLPRLGLCQALSPQKSKADPKYIEGLSEGQFFNTVSGVNYGDSVKIVPLLFYKNRFRFPPMGEGLRILCQSADSKVGVGDPGGDCLACPCAQFGEDGSRPSCTIFHNYAALALPKTGAPHLDALLAVSLKSTGLKVSKDWLALMRIRNMDTFSGIYEFTSVEKTSKVGRWFQPVIKQSGWVSQEVYEFARDAYAMTRSFQSEGKLGVDVSDLGASDIGREPGEEA